MEELNTSEHNVVNQSDDDQLSAIILQLKHRDSALKSQVSELQQKLRTVELDNEQLKKIAKLNESQLLIARESEANAERKAEKSEQEVKALKENLISIKSTALKAEEELKQCKKQRDELAKTCKSYLDESSRACSIKTKLMQELTELGFSVTSVSSEGSSSLGYAAGPSSEVIDPASSLAEVTEKSAKPRKRLVKTVGRQDQSLEYAFPEWLTETIPRRRPYFPQLGDELVYFWQGHKLHMDECDSKIYHLSRRIHKFLPYERHFHLPTEVPVRVAHVDFELKPHPFVVLQLEKLRGSGYLDVGYPCLQPDVDFLVFKKLYDQAENWKAGDRFRCMMEKIWKTGKVLRKKPLDCSFESSRFQCYQIRWDGVICKQWERLSAWDMEKIPYNFTVPENAKDGVPVTDQEFGKCLLELRSEDPRLFSQTCSKRESIPALVGALMKLPIAEAFLTSVDWRARPDLAQKIAYPMDLSTIKARLDNFFYRRSQAVVTDAERILINAKLLNKSDSDIVKHATVITEILLEIITDPDFGSLDERCCRLMDEYCGEDASANAPKKPKIERSFVELPDINASDNIEADG